MGGLQHYESIYNPNVHRQPCSSSWMDNPMMRNECMTISFPSRREWVAVKWDFSGYTSTSLLLGLADWAYIYSRIGWY